MVLHLGSITKGTATVDKTCAQFYVFLRASFREYAKDSYTLEACGRGIGVGACGRGMGGACGRGIGVGAWGGVWGWVHAWLGVWVGGWCILRESISTAHK